MSYITHSFNQGRLGNQLFIIGAVIGLCDKFERTPIFPRWDYNKYLENPIPSYKKKTFSPLQLFEPGFEYDREFWAKKINSNKGDIEVFHWLQSEKYFEDSKDRVREQFTIKKEYRDLWDRKLDYIDPNKKSIAISIRLGMDYVHNGNYEILPIDYYTSALNEYFAKDEYNILIFSDDFKGCRNSFNNSSLPFTYVEGSDIEQLYLMSKADHFILANSTFSWWGAFLGEKKHTKVIYPAYYFKKDLKDLNIKDFWPERWIKYDHKKSPV